VGIGTTSPSAKLSVVGNANISSSSDYGLKVLGASTYDGGIYVNTVQNYVYDENGLLSLNSNGSNVLRVGARGSAVFTGYGQGPALSIIDTSIYGTPLFVKGSKNPGVGGWLYNFKVNSGIDSTQFVVDNNGRVGIGLKPEELPIGYMLAVKGNIIAEKVRVKLQSSGWPDYVFKPGYQLPTLKETEAFIKTHQHLPGVPSAQQIKKEGLDVGDGQAVLLKKIEELTLHLIEINKRMEKLEKENEELKKAKSK
jgi:hypothetical protein